MTQTKTNKNLRRPSYRTSHRKLFWALIVVAVVTVGSVTAYSVFRYKENKAVAADRARFQQTDADMQKVATAIIKNVPPDKHTYTKTCKYQSRDYAPKPLGCTIEFQTVYGHLSYGQVERIFNDVTKTLANTDLNFLQAGSYSDSPLAVPLNDSANLLKKNSLYIDSKSKLECPLDYDITNSGQFIKSSSSLDNDKFNLSMTFQCYGMARASYYKLN